MIQEAENEQCIDKPSQLYDQNHWLIIKKKYGTKITQFKIRDQN
jgi:hypothetical protein